jgi:hypothetical protein
MTSRTTLPSELLASERVLGIVARCPYCRATYRKDQLRALPGDIKIMRDVTTGELYEYHVCKCNSAVIAKMSDVTPDLGGNRV